MAHYLNKDGKYINRATGREIKPRYYTDVETGEKITLLLYNKKVYVVGIPKACVDKTAWLAALKVKHFQGTSEELTTAEQTEIENKTVLQVAIGP